MLLSSITSLLLLTTQGGDGKLANRIHELVRIVLMTDNKKQESAAEADAKELFSKQGLPGITAVGDEAAYEFVFLTCSPGPSEFRSEVLRKAREGAQRHEIPADAVSYCAALARKEMVKRDAGKHPPADPALRDQIEELYQSDQAVRQKGGFDMQKMLRADTEHQAALDAIFVKYGVPTYRMVGPQAAADFVTMIQHQSPESRVKVLPGLKANVDAGQADPGSYAMMLDRSRSEAGKKEVYGENLVCDKEHPKLHPGPIEDEEHANQRRAEIGLMRLELYVEAVVAMMPNVCQ